MAWMRLVRRTMRLFRHMRAIRLADQSQEKPRNRSLCDSLIGRADQSQNQPGHRSLCDSLGSLADQSQARALAHRTLPGACRTKRTLIVHKNNSVFRADPTPGSARPTTFGDEKNRPDQITQAIPYCLTTTNTRHHLPWGHLRRCCSWSRHLLSHPHYFHWMGHTNPH
jgi:hypothetical protein